MQGSWMREEIGEQPAVIARLLEKESDRARKIGASLRKRGIRLAVFAARGSSDHAGVFAKYLVEWNLGLPAASAAPSIATLYKRPLRLSDAAVIGISQSGRSPDVVEYLRAARRAGAFTLAITNAASSPLAKAAAECLLCHAGPERSVAATKTFTAQLACLCLLVAGWRGGEAGRALELELARLPERLATCLSLEAEVAEMAARLCVHDRCWVLARGFSYPIALETALKIQEAAGLPSGGASAADFLHGPVAGVGQGAAVLALAAPGPGLPSLRAAVARARRAGAESFALGEDALLLRKASRSAYWPCGTEPASALSLAVGGQLLAYHLALRRGAEPDKPFGLTKVTRTW